MRSESPDRDRTVIFEAERRRLMGLAYRMLGSLADAEDVLQDAWLRWRATADEIGKPSAYLSAIVSRLCLDRLKRARRQREVYVGPWLPEPVPDDPMLIDHSPDAVAGGVSFALMLALERLSPLERAVFVLHDVFDMSFPDVAATLGRNEAACRQLASRARTHVRQARPRFDVARADADAIADAFFAASKTGDADTLARVLAEDVTLHTDGGGRKRAALNVIVGARKVARFFTGLARKPTFAPPTWSRPMRINGQPACLTVEADGTRQATIVELGVDRLTAIYVIRNPNKLERLWRMESGPVQTASTGAGLNRPDEYFCGIARLEAPG